MNQVMLTLHYPTGVRGVPIATTTAPSVMAQFKRAVLSEWQLRVESAEDEGEAMFCRLELARLRQSLDIAIPEAPSNG